MIEREEVCCGDSRIAYAVTRSARRRKTIAIKLDPAGGVLVVAPLRASSEQIREIVSRRATWILRRVSEGVLEPKTNIFDSGETLPYLGRDVRMEVSHDDLPGVRIRFIRQAFVVSLPAALEGEERRAAVHSAFVRWYGRRALVCVRASVAKWSGIAGASPSRIVVRDQRRRWGSCAPDGTLRFNWRIVMAPPEILDYVVVHELVHLNHRNHSRNFWAAVEQVMPDYAARRAELNKTGPRLPL